MLYKIDKNGFVVNEAGLGKIQPYYRKILEEIEGCEKDLQKTMSKISKLL